MRQNNVLENDLERLSSAEEFLHYFNIAFEQSVVNVYRLHILKRFHDFLKKTSPEPTLEKCELYDIYGALLLKAYNDFALQNQGVQKTFQVFEQSKKKCPSGCKCTA